MKALAHWCVRHRRLVVLFWLIALVGTTVISQTVGSAYSNSFTLPHTESTQALTLLQDAAPKVAGDREQIVFHTTDGTKVTDPAVVASVNAMLAKVREVPHVTSAPDFSPSDPSRRPPRSAPTEKRGSSPSRSTSSRSSSRPPWPSSSWPPH